MLELIHKALFAFISGFSELVFVSPAAHQLIYRTVTGYSLTDNFLSFGIHIGCLVALLMNCHQRIKYLRYQKRLDRPTKRRHIRQPDAAALSDIRILNTAVWPILLGFLLYRKATDWICTPFRLVLVLIANGLILFLPRLLRSGNKDSQSFSGFDGLLMGLAGALGMFPGFSRTGCMYSVAAARGAQKSYGLEHTILLSIPAVAAMLCIDIYGCTVALAGITGFQILGALVAAVMAFLGSHLALMAIRFVCSHSSGVFFSYYNWGMAMFLLLIYLFVS